MSTVLSIDGSVSMSAMIRFALEAGGFGVVQAINVQDALEKVAQGDVDLVLTELNLPETEDGLALIRKLRENPKFKKTPILILTTESSDQMKQAGRSAGASGLMLKPFDPTRLLFAISKLLC